MRGQSRSARVAGRWNKTSRAEEFRARCICARGTVFTLAQPGSLIKMSAELERASKRPIPEPLSSPRQIPYAPLRYVPHEAQGAATAKDQEISMEQTPDVAGAANTNGSAVGAQHQAHLPEVNWSENGELRQLLPALQAMRVGDFSVRMAGDQVGIMGKVADTFNEIVAANQRIAQQLERVGQVVGREGKTRQRVRSGSPRVPGARWRPRSTR